MNARIPAFGNTSKENRSVCDEFVPFRLGFGAIAAWKCTDSFGGS